MICAASESGKTYLAKQILENAVGVFSEEPTKISLCYDTWQPMFDELCTNINEIVFHQGLPSENHFNEWAEIDGHKVLVIDDLMSEGVDCPHLMKMFCVKSHHQNFTVIFLVQNVFQKGKVMRTLSLNTQYFILFKNYRDQSQVETLGRQIFPRQTDYFRSAYQAATSRRYGYLLIDVSPTPTEVNIEGVMVELSSLRTKILPGEDTVLYYPKK